MLAGFDEDLAEQINQVSNRIRGLLTQIHPALERAGLIAGGRSLTTLPRRQATADRTGELDELCQSVLQFL